MAIRAYFETAEGETVPFPVEPTPEQGVFVALTMAVGMNRLNKDTIDEFVRRAELYQTYITYGLYDLNGPVLVGRAILTEMLGDHQLAWTNASTITKADFDAMIAEEKAAAKTALR